MENKLRFLIPRELVLNSNQSINHRVKGLKVKALREMGCALGNSIEEKPFNRYSVDVLVYAPSKRRIDPPNMYPTVKPLVDGLTDSGLWEDDDYKHMDYMKFSYGGESKLPKAFILDLIVKEV